MGNFQVFVSKNRNLPSERLGGKRNHLGEHLPGLLYRQDQHLPRVGESWARLAESKGGEQLFLMCKIF
jgi:hypothetical protein